MQCFDCPELGDFDGRPTPRAACCLDEHARRMEALDEQKAKREAAFLGGRPNNRQARRALARAQRKCQV